MRYGKGSTIAIHYVFTRVQLSQTSGILVTFVASCLCCHPREEISISPSQLPASPCETGGHA
jgi:hypothetical protein